MYKTTENGGTLVNKSEKIQGTSDGGLEKKTPQNEY